MEKTVSEKAGSAFGVRHVQYVLMFSATILAYGTRTVLNVAVVAMVSNKTSEYYPTYPEWKSEKNLMLSSFFWGYVCLQIGAGQLARKYGPKLFLGCALFIASIFTILVPIFGDKFGVVGVIACRVLQGACQGFLLPSLHNLLSSWTHITERAKWGGKVYSGQALGNVVAMPITGLICASKYGWPCVFYVYGGLGIIWCILWLIFGSDNPSKHKGISDGEKLWLENKNLDVTNEHQIPTPWIKIFTSLPFIAIIIAHSGENWGYWTLLTEIPSYMNDILGFDIASNSLLSALPYLIMWLLNMVMSPVADKLIEKRTLSVEMSRKVFNSIAFFIPAIALTALGLISTTQQGIVITILIIAVAFNAGQYCGFMVNHIDLAPNHAGTLMAITNSTATVFSIIAPLAVDVMSSISGYKEKDQRLWNIVFFVAAAVHVVTGAAFDVLGSGKIQPWNSPVGGQDIQPIDEMNKKVLRKLSTLSV